MNPGALLRAARLLSYPSQDNECSESLREVDSATRRLSYATLQSGRAIPVKAIDNSVSYTLSMLTEYHIVLYRNIIRE